MASYNKIIIMGHATTDAEMKFSQSGVQVTKFNVAVNRWTKKDEHPECDFFPVVAFRKLAEICAEYVKEDITERYRERAAGAQSRAMSFIARFNATEALAERTQS